MVLPPIPLATALQAALGAKQQAALDAKQQAALDAKQQAETVRIDWWVGNAVALPRVTSLVRLLRHPLLKPELSWGEFCEQTDGMTTDEMLTEVHALRSAR